MTKYKIEPICARSLQKLAGVLRFGAQMKSAVIRPVFGVSCKECGDQVPMARVRALGLESNPSRVFCAPCQTQREVRERRNRLSERPQDTVIIRG